MINIETAREIKKYALKYNVSFDILLKSLDLNSFDENMIKDIADKLNIEKVQLFTFEMWKYDSPNDEFRGWVLPNGKMVNRFFDRSGEPKTVQDHGKLFQIFLFIFFYQVDIFLFYLAKLILFIKIRWLNCS